MRPPDQRLVTRRWFAAACVVVLLKFLLCSHAETLYAAWDSAGYVESAGKWHWGAPYEIYSYIRVPTFNLYLASVNALGVPVRLANEVVLAFSALLVAQAVWACGLTRITAWLIFALLTLHPWTYYIFNLVTPDGLYATLLVAFVAAMVLPSDHGPAYEGWLPLFAVLSALLVYSLQAPGPVRRLLSTPLLVSTGAISYGLYLFHWPVFVLLRERGWDLTSPPHLVGALAITVTVSLVSYRLVERPVRRTSWRPVPTLRLAAIASVIVLASAVLVAPSGPAISADDDLLDAAAIAPDDG
jgi:peptidoglycan/LPS O-acetylase OafA/YrhL